jgi:Carbohydrate (N-acetylglucosamine 6-O) sulfotransferase 5.
MVYSESDAVSGTSIITTPSLKVFSSLGQINDMYFESLSPMLITSSLIDTNFDNLADFYDFNITVYTSPANVRNIKILSFYDYSIKSRIKMDMVGLAYVDISTPCGASFVYIDGELNIKQVLPLKPTSVIRADYNSSVLSLTSAADNFLPLLLLRYNNRNETTIYNYQSLVLPVGSNEYSTISMKVRVPPNQEYEYSPGFLEVMKFAWVQYISLLIPVGYLIYRFAGFIYRNQILESHVTYENKIIK